MLLEYLSRRPKGVCIPSTLHKNQESRLSMGEQILDAADMPAMQLA